MERAGSNAFAMRSRACRPSKARLFWLRCIEQLSYAEIGQQLKLDANTVGVLVHRARMHLRQVLADLNPVKH